MQVRVSRIGAARGVAGSKSPGRGDIVGDMGGNMDMSWTGMRVRPLRALLAVAAVGAVAVGMTGCTSSTTSGEAVPIPTAGDYPQPVIQAAGLDGVTCATPSTAYDTYCESTAGASIAVEGATIKLRAGDPITLTASSGKARTCAVGAFVKDNAGALYAVSGPSCATSTGVATTTDGYRIGEYRTIIVRSQVTRRVPVVKLTENVHWEQSAKSISAAVPDTSVKVITPHGPLEWSNANAETLVWRGTGTAPTMKPGDAGSPITQGEKLVGLGDQAQGLLDSAQLRMVLAGIGSGVALAV